jgi:class 3 adenylate cyclase
MFLLSASKIIQSMGGVITAFNGDRVMSIFIDGSKNTNAVKSAMQIAYLIREINNRIQIYYQITYKLDFGIGIDTGKLFVVRAGV